MTRHRICNIDQLPEGSRALRQITDRMSVGVFHIDGRVVAFRNHCPHNGAPVCEGTLSGTVLCNGEFERHLAHEGRILRCPWHAWEFLLPEGVTLTQPPYRLLSHPVVIEDGEVFVELPGGAAPATAATA